ncbi:porin [Methylococcus sp. Mc7]|uniref:porin n=1 Tax=Methylococcus sp. Mc7 TaxID=2860258 RepID=UPI001C52ACCE|nr:porin [Methylococcus sp. Mc7]QXP84374.1 porin [Methylococcus sp. Mc7]
MKSNLLRVSVTALMGGVLALPAHAAIELYMDKKTKQIYAEPGPGRIRMGTFEQVDETDSKLARKKSELEELSKKLDQQKAEIAKAQAEAAKVASTESKKEKGQAKVFLSGDKGLEIESADGNFKASMGGRLQLASQVNWHQNNFESLEATPYRLNDGTTFRRARIFTEGTFYKDYEWRFEYDFVRGSGVTSTGITDAFLKVKALEPVEIVFGQFKEPFSLESVTSNRYTTFMERSLPNNAFVEFANPYLIGAEVDGRGNLFEKAWTGRLAFQTEPVGPGNPNNSTTSGNSNRNNYAGNTGYGVTGRLTYLPLEFSHDEILHTGVSLGYRTPNNNITYAQGVPNLRNGGMSFGSQPDTSVDRSSFWSTGNLTDPKNGKILDHFTRINAELAGVYGPFSLQGEYFRTQISGDGYGSNDLLQGYYTFGSFFLTGESRPYDKKRGAFGRVVPKANFDFSGQSWGAWEIAYRWDYLDMNSEHINGGRGQIGTLALNWYINPRVKWMNNYVHIFGLDQNKNAPAGLYSLNGANNDVFMSGIWMDW